MPPPREPLNPQQRGRRRQESMPGGWLWLVVLVLLAIVVWFTFAGSSGVIDYSQFMALAREGKFERVIQRGDTKAIGEIRASEVDKLDENIKKQVRYNN